MKKLLIVLCVFLMTACASNSEITAPTYIALEPIVPDAIAEKLTKREAVYLELGVIPGALYGSPLDEPLWYIDMSEVSAPAFDPVNFARELKKYAKPAVESSYQIEVIPKNTKFLRVSTLGVDAQDKKYLNGGLRDEKGDYLMLAYFDRPCRITGQADFDEDGIYEHDIKIEKPGIYKLIAQPFQGRQKISAYSNQKTIGVILSN